MGKLPSLQFYPGDWLRDAVAGCSLAAQGLWLRLMLVMHDAEEYGHLQANGELMQPETIARRCGCTVEEYQQLLEELTRAGVPSRTTQGVIYSRRMVRDAAARAEAAGRQRKHRDGCHASVTEMSQRSSSSSSASTSTSKQETKPMSASADVRTPPPQPPELRFEGEQITQPQSVSQRSEANLTVQPDPRILLEIYEQERGTLPAIKAFTDERRGKCRTRLLSHAHGQEQFLADFRASIRKASQLPLPQWRPPFDWFIANNTNFRKVLEGNYDQWGNGTSRKGAINADERTRSNFAAAGLSPN